MDKGGKLAGCRTGLRDGEVAGGLQSPAAVEGVFCQRQKLYMAEVVFQQPGDELPASSSYPPANRAVGLGGVGLRSAAGMEFVMFMGRLRYSSRRSIHALSSAKSPVWSGGWRWRGGTSDAKA